MTSSDSAVTSPTLPSSQLVLVTGKGGVGRSTVASAVAVELARRGGRVALVHPVDAPPVHHAANEPASFEVRSLDRDESLDQYLSDVLPGPFAAALRASRAFRLITAATPGLGELLVIGELLRLSLAGYDHLVYDAPATGHLLALLDAPSRFERAAAVGPIARRANELGTWIHDPKVTSGVAVTTGDALAVSELGDLVDQLEARLGRMPELVVANRLAPASPAAAELDALDGVDVDAGVLDAVRRLASRSRSERAQLGKVTRRLGTPPLQSLERPDHPVEAVLDALAPLGVAV
jgi:anion-transporting  ArsA/GET3 family ATPase